MDYQTTLDHLYRLERFGIKLGLDNVRRLLSLLGDPHRDLRVLHVTGTNGKGSVCAYAASALQSAGYRVGLYTSPHLIRFNERIRVDGEPISDDDVLRLWSGMQPAIHAMTAARPIDHPTFFEVTTAMAFLYFRERRVDVSVTEVGMGAGWTRRTSSTGSSPSSRGSTSSTRTIWGRPSSGLPGRRRGSSSRRPARSRWTSGRSRSSRRDAARYTRRSPWSAATSGSSEGPHSR